MRAQIVQIHKICATNDPIMYTISGENGTKFHWYIKNGNFLNPSDSLKDTIWVKWPLNPGRDTCGLTVSAELDGCIAIKKLKVIVNPTPIIDLEADTTFCQGHPWTKTIPIGFKTVDWIVRNDTFHGNTFTFDTTTTVAIKVTNDFNCSAGDTLNVTMLKSPSKVDLGKDHSLCGFDTLRLDAGNPGCSYSWFEKDSTMINYAQFSISQTVTIKKGAKRIFVIVTNQNGCSTGDTINIQACNVPFDTIPTAFTPNGDGKNDFWEIKGLSDKFPSVIVEVYDRWGRLLFRSAKGYPKPWDGSTDNGPLPMDTYFYIIDLNGNGKNLKHGTITIIR